MYEAALGREGWTVRVGRFGDGSVVRDDQDCFAELVLQIDEQAELMRAAQKAVTDWEAELNDITNYTFGTRRAALMQNIDEARQAMAAAQRSIDDLEDQARRQGIRVTLP